jgi:hypothetical protein
MGRGERNYPDYVLGADSRLGEEIAAALIECKLNINTNKELEVSLIMGKRAIDTIVGQRNNNRKSVK